MTSEFYIMKRVSRTMCKWFAAEANTVHETGGLGFVNCRQHMPQQKVVKLCNKISNLMQFESYIRLFLAIYCFDLFVSINATHN